MKHILVILTILVSGSVFFYKDYGVVFIPLYVLIGFLYYIKSPHKWDKKSIAFLSYTVGWLLFNNYWIHGGVSTNIVFSCILCIVGAFFTITSINLKDFRELLLKYLSILSAISILVQVCHNYLFDIGSVSKADHIHLSFFFFNTEWGDNRLSSIFWEPGLYQIIIIYTLCLFVDELKNTGMLAILKRFGVLFLALAYTKSTMGYVSFALFLIFLQIETGTYKNVKYMISSLLLVLITIVLIVQSTAVQDKKEQYEKQVGTSSLMIRMADNLALLVMTSERPWVGYGMDSKDYERRNRSLDNPTASNGWLNASACNGIPYLCAFLFFMYNGIKRQKTCRYPILFFLVLVFAQCNEYIITFPYVMMYIFKYDHYIYKWGLKYKLKFLCIIIMSRLLNINNMQRDGQKLFLSRKTE